MITDIVEAIFSIIKEIPEMIDAFSGMELSSSSEAATEGAEAATPA